MGKPLHDVPAATEFADALFATLHHTRDMLERAKRKYEVQLGNRRRKPEVYRAGDRVLLATKDLDLRCGARKLTCKFVGPFEVLASPHPQANPNCVYLKVPTALKIHMPINVKNVKRYHSRPDRLGGSVNEVPQPLQANGQSLWEVEEILAERVKYPKRKKPLHQVLVKWTGFNVLDATWEPINNMPTAVLEQWRQLQQEQIFSGLV